ncbi:transcription initiation factor TFIID subunit 12-like [Babylonia areolata]|uniref:transcription initiation factor TFIID subunit 12-like n=1 Tax=Babylonia areolata TaxID=304850 RepID=UPI003FD10F0B
MSVNKSVANDSTNTSNMGSMTQTQAGVRVSTLPPQGAGGGTGGGVIDRKRLQELVKEVDPLEQMDDDVEEALLTIADNFIESVVSTACQLAKHRKSNTLEVKDVQLCLERSHSLWVPGFGSEDMRPMKKAAVTEAHRQRQALIRKTMKKS